MTSSTPEPIIDSEIHKNALLLQLTTEVRHTLHHVLGSIELITEEALSLQQNRHLTRCRDSAHELMRIVNDISELADLGPPNKTACLMDVATMLEDFTGLIKFRAERKHLDVCSHVDRQTPRFVIGNRQVVESTLYRLVDNSIKFSQSGRITITVKALGSDEAGQLVFEVSDRGAGLAPSELEDLRRPVSESRNEGLGLRVVRKRLAEIGGRLDVISSSSEGTTLAIVVPVLIPQEGGNSHAPCHRQRAGSLRVLLAEDSDDSFAVFATFVKDEGHRITRALNGAEAVEIFKGGCFDIVVMDINMPVMDGYTATRLIREWETQQGRPRLPILLLSADDPGRQGRMGSLVGCSGYLTKPIPKPELLFALRHYTAAGSLRDGTA